MKRLGKQTLEVVNNCYIIGRGSLVGEKEKNGTFRKYMEHSTDDDKMGEKTFEKGERKMLRLINKRAIKDAELLVDDIDIYLNGTEVKNFGSQGQQRTAALSLKLAELEIIKSITGEYPVLILDDVFSELDEERRKRLVKFTSRCQTIITTTDESFCEGKIIKIQDGKVVNN